MKLVLGLAALAACGGGGGADAGDTDDAGPVADAAAGADAIDASDGILLAERFDGSGAGWPGWTELGGVDEVDRVAGRGRVVPMVTTYSLGRLGRVATFTDVDVTLRLEFAELSSQGVGLYLRQNGGYLQTGAPHGQGYAVFVEGFRAQPGVGVWREVDGVEEQILVADNPVAGMTSGEVYAVRFQVVQEGGVTRLRARLWRDGETEPAAWNVDVTDATAALQGTAGAVAIDAWSSYSTSAPGTPADVLVDDLELRAAP